MALGIVATCACCRKDEPKASRRRPVVIVSDHKRSIGTLCCALTVHSLMAERAFSRVYAERLILCTFVISALTLYSGPILN